MSPLRVGIDASAAAVAQPTGIGLSIAHMVEALHALPGVDALPLYRLSRFRRRRHFLPGPGRLYHERWSVLLARGLDVFHGADARLPRFAHPALVATVHDLSARRPGFATERFRATREAHWAQVRERAHQVITYTEAVREEVVRELGIPPERVTAVPLAPTLALGGPPDPGGEQDLAERVRGKAPHVLFLGELSPRKNAVGAVEAYAASQSLLPLVMVGPRTRFTGEVEAAIERLGLRGQVVMTHYLPVAQLRALLRTAAALLFPTRYEGFGMPILEAFRIGLPVVTSNDPSVLEVSGGVALHADADDVEGLAAHLQRLSSPALREELATRGRERAALFSWERTAQGLLGVYARAAGVALPAVDEVETCSR